MYFLSAGKDSKLQGQHITTFTIGKLSLGLLFKSVSEMKVLEVIISSTVKHIFKLKTNNFQSRKEIHLDIDVDAMNLDK